MATYAIGDVQGCCDELERLFELIEFSPEHDRLWLCGDMVNRGSRSLATLELVFSLRHSLIAVLGNHDLHLLKRVAGVAAAKRRDTLDAILGSPRCEELADWLRHRPLVHREGDTIVVHAGIPPRWDWDEIERRVTPVHAALRSDDWKKYLASPELEDGRDGETVRALTQLRMVDSSGQPVFGFSGSPEDAPAGQIPWFTAAGRRLARETIVFGHWAALGLHMSANAIGLDSACVWKGKLTALRLEDKQIFQVDCTAG